VISGPYLLTPTVCKHLEAIVGGWILEAIADKLDAKQFGRLNQMFNCSTNDVLVDMIHHWDAALDSGSSTRVFLWFLQKH